MDAMTAPWPLLLLLLLLATISCAPAAASTSAPFSLRLLLKPTPAPLFLGSPLFVKVELKTTIEADIAARQPPALELCLGLRQNSSSFEGGGGGGRSFRVDPDAEALRCEHDELASWNFMTPVWTSRPLKLANIGEGNHSVWAVLRHRNVSSSGGGQHSAGHIVGRTPLVTHFEVVAAPPVFEPSYDWAPVLPGQAVPQGLDVRLDIGEGGKTARIPPEWRLQVWLEDAPPKGSFFRKDIAAKASVGA